MLCIRVSVELCRMASCCSTLVSSTIAARCLALAAVTPSIQSVAAINTIRTRFRILCCNPPNLNPKIFFMR